MKHKNNQTCFVFTVTCKWGYMLNCGGRQFHRCPLVAAAPPWITSMWTRPQGGDCSSTRSVVWFMTLWSLTDRRRLLAIYLLLVPSYKLNYYIVRTPYFLRVSVQSQHCAVAGNQTQGDTNLKFKWAGFKLGCPRYYIFTDDTVHNPVSTYYRWYILSWLILSFGVG